MKGKLLLKIKPIFLLLFFIIVFSVFLFVGCTNSDYPTEAYKTFASALEQHDNQFNFDTLSDTTFGMYDLTAYLKSDGIYFYLETGYLRADTKIYTLSPIIKLPKNTEPPVKLVSIETYYVKDTFMHKTHVELDYKTLDGEAEVKAATFVKNSKEAALKKDSSEYLTAVNNAKYYMMNTNCFDNMVLKLTNGKYRLIHLFAPYINGVNISVSN